MAPLVKLAIVSKTGKEASSTTISLSFCIFSTLYQKNSHILCLLAPINFL